MERKFSGLTPEQKAFEDEYTKALEEGDACPGCAREPDGTRVFGRHKLNCLFRMKHGCPTCSTKTGPHPETCRSAADNDYP